MERTRRCGARRSARRSLPGRQHCSMACPAARTNQRRKLRSATPRTSVRTSTTDGLTPCNRFSRGAPGSDSSRFAMTNSSLNHVAAFAGFPFDLRVKELEEQVLSMRTAVICGFNQLLDLKDLNTGVHSTRLAEWAVRVAEGLGIDETILRDVEAAAILHDIGKIGVPDSILKKHGES